MLVQNLHTPYGFDLFHRNFSLRDYNLEAVDAEK